MDHAKDFQHCASVGLCCVLLVSDDGGERWARFSSPIELDGIVSASFPEETRAIFATSSAVYWLIFS